METQELETQELELRIRELEDEIRSTGKRVGSLYALEKEDVVYFTGRKIEGQGHAPLVECWYCGGDQLESVYESLDKVDLTGKDVALLGTWLPPFYETRGECTERAFDFAVELRKRGAKMIYPTRAQSVCLFKQTGKRQGLE